jgi:predicted lipoprotein with Yx(FWY)xxD motif
MRKLLFLLMLTVGVFGLVAARGAPATGNVKMSAARKSVVVSTRRLPRLGLVLVDSRGRTLYMFVPDKRRKVTCVRTCAVIWPPLKLPKGARLVARGKAKRSLLGSDRDPAGGRVVTYNRWPLYTYVSDKAPGQAKGQALNLNGGLWYVLPPSGKVIRKKA